MLRQPLFKSAALTVSKYVCSCYCARRLFKSSAQHAYAARSPTVKRNERMDKYNFARGIKPTSPDRLTESDLQALPPPGLLHSAHDSGAIPISVGQAVQVLLAFIKLGSRPTPEELRKLCKDHKIEAKDLTLLARIQLRSSTIRRQEVATTLLFAACSLSEKGATFQVVSQGINKHQLDHPQFKEALKNLNIFAQQKHPQALVLKGQIALSQGQEAAALKFFEEATKSTVEMPESESDVGGPREAWLALGRGSLTQGNYAEAEKAFRIAADMDDPAAYHYLAKMQNTSPEDRESYLLKAAASGITLAAHDLGLLYAERANKVASEKQKWSGKAAKTAASAKQMGWPHRIKEWFFAARSTAVSARRMVWIQRASEWYCVSGSGSERYVPSLLELAKLCKTEGGSEGYEAGLEQLKRAENSQSAPQYIEQIKKVRESFTLKESDRRSDKGRRWSEMVRRA